MNAALWLILMRGGESGGSSAATGIGIEARAADGRLHGRAEDRRLHGVAKDTRLHGRFVGEN